MVGIYIFVSLSSSVHTYTYIHYEEKQQYSNIHKRKSRAENRTPETCTAYSTWHHTISLDWTQNKSNSSKKNGKPVLLLYFASFPTLPTYNYSCRKWKGTASPYSPSTTKKQGKYRMQKGTEKKKKQIQEKKTTAVDVWPFLLYCMALNLADDVRVWRDALCAHVLFRICVDWLSE